MKKSKILLLIVLSLFVSSINTTSAFYTSKTNYTNNFKTNSNSMTINFKTNSSDLVYGSNAHISKGKIYLPNINRNGYNFLGYGEVNKNASYNGGQYVSINNLNGKTLEAKYSLINYSIGYNLNSGALASGKTNPTSYNIESNNFTLNNPSRVGWNFNGWTGTGLSTNTTTVSVNKGSTGNRNYTANWKDDIAPVIKNIKITTLRYVTAEECQNTSTFKVAIEVRMLEQGSGFDHYNVSLAAVGEAHGTGFDVSAGATTTNNGDGTITVRAEDECWVGGMNRDVTLKTFDAAGNYATNNGIYYIGL